MLDDNIQWVQNIPQQFTRWLPSSSFSQRLCHHLHGWKGCGESIEKQRVAKGESLRPQPGWDYGGIGFPFQESLQRFFLLLYSAQRPLSLKSCMVAIRESAYFRGGGGRNQCWGLTRLNCPPYSRFVGNSSPNRTCLLHTPITRWCLLHASPQHLKKRFN